MDDQQPVVRIDAGNGRAYYPVFEKNTQGGWEMKEKEFLKMLSPHIVLEKSIKQTDRE